MPTPKYERLCVGVLRHIGVSEAVLTAKGATYRWRRFKPSVGEACEFAKERLQSVGNWQEIPGSKDSAKPKATHPMYRRYAEGVVGFSAESKGLIMAALHRCKLSLQKEGDVDVANTEIGLQIIRASGLAESELVAEWQSEKWEHAPQPAGYATQARVFQECSPEHAAPEAKGMSPDTPAMAQSEESESESLFDFTSLDEEQDSQEERIGEESIDTELVDWFVQAAHGREPFVHISKDFPPGGFPLPYCRSEPFCSWPQEMGVGVNDMNATGCEVCSKCRAKAPTAVKFLLAQFGD